MEKIFNMWLLPILTFIFGFVISRIIDWKKIKLEEKKEFREVDKQRFAYHDSLTEKLSDMVALIENFHKEKDIRKRKGFLAKIDLARNNIMDLENHLAKLENRQSRDLIKRLRPSPPANLNLSPVEGPENDRSQ